MESAQAEGAEVDVPFAVPLQHRRVGTWARDDGWAAIAPSAV
jgi:hypothetical protein